MSKFDKLFEKIITECNINCTEKSPWKNEEYIHEWVRKDFKVIIAKMTGEDPNDISYEFIVGKIEPDSNEVIDWPYYESSDAFETEEAAIDAAEDYLADYYANLEDDEDDYYPEPDQGEDYINKDLALSMFDHIK